MRERGDNLEVHFLHAKKLLEQNRAKVTMLEERLEKVDGFLNDIESNSNAVKNLEDDVVDSVDRTRQFLAGYF